MVYLGGERLHQICFRTGLYLATIVAGALTKVGSRAKFRATFVHSNDRPALHDLPPRILVLQTNYCFWSFKPGRD